MFLKACSNTGTCPRCNHCRFLVVSPTGQRWALRRRRGLLLRQNVLSPPRVFNRQLHPIADRGQQKLSPDGRLTHPQLACCPHRDSDGPRPEMLLAQAPRQPLHEVLARWRIVHPGCVRQRNLTSVPHATPTARERHATGFPSGRHPDQLAPALRLFGDSESQPGILDVVTKNLVEPALRPHGRRIAAAARLPTNAQAFSCFAKRKIVPQLAHRMEHHVDVVESKLSTLGGPTRLLSKDIEVEGQSIPCDQRVALVDERLELLEHGTNLYARHLRRRPAAVNTMPGQGFSFTRDHSSCTRDAERSMRQQIADLRRQDLRCLKIERDEPRCHMTPLSRPTACGITRSRAAALGWMPLLLSLIHISEPT